MYFGFTSLEDLDARSKSDKYDYGKVPNRKQPNGSEVIRKEKRQSSLQRMEYTLKGDCVLFEVGEPYPPVKKSTLRGNQGWRYSRLYMNDPKDSNGFL
jgi:hypothetical protein